MPRSYSSVYLHIVFSTKDRHPFLHDPVTRQEVHRYLGGISKTLESQPMIVGGTSDHVHLLVKLGKSMSQAELVKELKRVSSSWIHRDKPQLRDFAWQGGYGAFSIDARNIEPVRTYIATQEEHHRKLSFQEELLALLGEHGEEVDERYMWG